MWDTWNNSKALIEEARGPSSSGEIVAVNSNRPGAQGQRGASLAGIQTLVVDHKRYGSRAEFDGTVVHVLEEFGVKLVSGSRGSPLEDTFKLVL
ncbi:hypothetical protein EPR50_G00238010 [Perca flavescens]|uniref:Formyl transferase N-terminal domain-containing protein n=1 Tax=Perca flavescens TaxID=8167 RepID=A0A484BZB4_PERFV|nr:hypothetical protein EPR50_G00238010 [Perca flavescens]